MAKRWTDIFIEKKDTSETPKVESSKKAAPQMPAAFGAASSFNLSTPEVAKVVDSFASEITPPTFTEQMPVNQQMVDHFEKYLDKINKPGYDFLEFYRAVKNVGDSQNFKTAFSVASSFDSTLSKQKLLQDADFYIESVQQVVSESKKQAKEKLDKITSDINAKNAAFTEQLKIATAELEKVKAQYDALLSSRPNLSEELASQTGEVNNTLRELVQYEGSLISSLTKVKTNIENYL